MPFFAIVTGFSIGLLGSLHCLGMCGPIALSLPVNKFTTARKYLSIILYNLGRASSYAAMGVLFGFLGSSFHFFGIQRILSIVGGLLILSFALVYYLNPSWLSTGRWSSKISNLLGTHLKKDKTYGTFWLIGLFNGLLPCGLVYLALASAFTTGSVLDGMLLMFAFGLGTLPLMSFLMIAGKWVKESTRIRLRQLVPIWVIALATLMILRGLNLGIPYLSPSLQTDSHQVKCCSTTDKNNTH